MSTWIVRLAPNVESWLLRLPDFAQDAVVAATEVLQEYGPWLELSVLDLPAIGPMSISLLGGALTLSYSLDLRGRVIIVVNGHAGDDGHGRQVELAQLLGASFDVFGSMAVGDQRQQ